MKQINSLMQLDLNGVYSYADYLTWKFEQAVELIKGKILPMAAPNVKHQRISWQLTMGIGQYFYKNSTNCRAFAAPFDVRLYDKEKTKSSDQNIYTVVQPDMCIICDTNKLDEQGCQGAPDLIVEILSKGNSKKEMRLKKDLYEENQVREYWVFDPERESVTQFVLNEQGVYKTVNFVFSDEILTSAIFEGLKIDLSQIFMP